MGRLFTIATVVDRHPRFYVELILWATCVTRVLPSRLFRPVVYFVGQAPNDLTSWLSLMNIDWANVEPLEPESPHCNKILPFLHTHETQHIVVTDTDLFFVANPANLLATGSIQAAPNNHCRPPAKVFRSIMEKAGCEHLFEPGVSLLAGQSGQRETYRNNISAGIVSMPTDKAAHFATIWRERARWLIANRNFLGPYHRHVDQVSFALAIAEAKEALTHLPPQVNLILHMLEAVDTAYAFHLTTGHIPKFPQRFLPCGRLCANHVSEGMAMAIGVLNGCILQARDWLPHLASTKDHRHMFLNPTYCR